MKRKLELGHFLSFLFFFFSFIQFIHSFFPSFNGLWISCTKKHLSGNREWFLYPTVLWNANTESGDFYARKSRDDSFIVSRITSPPKEFLAGIWYPSPTASSDNFRLHLLLASCVTLRKLLKLSEITFWMEKDDTELIELLYGLN